MGQKIFKLRISDKHVKKNSLFPVINIIIIIIILHSRLPKRKKEKNICQTPFLPLT